MKRELQLKIVRYRIRVRGRVQGVGFRYHALKLAEQLKINGFVKNESDHVLIEVEGREETLRIFIRSLRTKPPRECRITSIESETHPLKGGRGFEVS